MRQVYTEHGDCRTPDGAAAKEDGPLPAEMAVPLLPAGIEHPCPLAGFGIDPSELGPLW